MSPAPEPAPERRRGERRRADRRAVAHEAAESFFDPGWLGPGLRPAAPTPGDDGALDRIVRIYVTARAVLGVALVAAQAAGNLSGTRAPVALVLLCIAYAGQAVTLWLLPRFRTLTTARLPPAVRRRQWFATIGVDLLAFGAMHAIESASSFNYAPLLVLPVLMAGVMTQRLLALGTAAGVTLVLLVNAGRSGLANNEAAAALLQAGLAGLGLFVIALLAGELAGRLAREEQAARGSAEIARQQAQLNRLVIEEMVDGVMVVDADLRVRAANPAARALLVSEGLSPPAPFALGARPAWRALADAVRRARVELEWPPEGRDLTLVFDSGERQTLRLRVRFMRGDRLAAAAATAPAAVPAGDPFCVLLLEDARTAQARLQQEKLAAMGRVSAGIAHEIRNPLAAISQANALLMEDGLPPAQARLAGIVADNAARLKRIVDDVLDLAPGAEPLTPQPLDAVAATGAAAAEWAATVGVALGADSRLQVELPGAPAGVRFDADHWRRVLVNLLDNAHRHASAAPGAIRVAVLVDGDAAVQLSVVSDGPPIAPDVERYLFEPFFSTRSRGTGLGLYICRELCERHGAHIEYRPRAVGERVLNEFLVTLRRAPLPGAPAALFPTP